MWRGPLTDHVLCRLCCRLVLCLLQAEEEQNERGEESDLHIIIFDEIDAICKKRGSVSGSTGVNDSVVNQLLSKIDGVDALNNILVIGKRLPRPRLPTATLFVLRVCVVRNG